MKTITLSRDEYIERKKRQLDDWNAEITAFEANVTKSKYDLTAKTWKQILVARKNFTNSSKKLEAVKNSAVLSWEDLKTETENVFTAFKDSVDEFKMHF